MSKLDARTIQQVKKRNIAIAFFILIAILIVFVIVLSYIIIRENNSQELSYSNLSTVEDVLNYYGCTYISEKKSKDENYDIDITLKFKYELYDGEKSNETFFNNIIEDVARVLNYINFRMIDTEKEIQIEVKCEDNEVIDIIINGIENYFSYMDSQIALRKYVEIPKTELLIESPELQQLINNNWSSQTSLGTRDSIFENYYEYFEEGIKTRTINGKIYNIVFTSKYQGNVINGLFPGIEGNAVEAKLGEAPFKDEQLEIVGYKGKDIYVFFCQNEISIYRIENENMKAFFDLVDRLLNEELDLLDFMNELTYLWPDYSEYEYSENSVFLSYPLKGIDVKLGYEDTDAIVVYNNIHTTQDELKPYLECLEFVSNLQIDNVFNAEKRRIEKKNELLDKCEEYESNLEEEEKQRIGKSSKFSIYPEIDSGENILKMYFISKDGNYPNREIYETVSSYLWINDDLFVYSQTENGIYVSNITTGQKTVIIRGNETYNVKSFENGILKYDESELIIQY